MVVLVLPEQVAPDSPTKPALNPKFDPVVVLVPPVWAAPDPPTKLAPKPRFNWVKGCELALKPKFCCLPLIPGGANVTSGIAPRMLRPMAVKGISPGDKAIFLAFAAAAVAMAAIGILQGDKGMALAFAATAVVTATFVGGGDGVRDIVALLGESWV